MKLTTQKAVIDHVGVCPAPKTTKRGFVENGMIDNKVHLCPDIYEMIKTCKSEVLKEHKYLLFYSFLGLYSIMRIEGHIKEEVYDRLGFPSDTNYEGEKVDKPDNISQEMQHQAKVLSNDLQCELCERKDVIALNAERKQEKSELILSNALHVWNIDTTKIVFPNTDDIIDELIDFNSLPIETIKQRARALKLLKGFINVQLFDTATIPSGQASRIPTTNGNLEDINIMKIDRSQ